MPAWFDLLATLILHPRFALPDAAKILEATPKAVESRLYRARRILRERLKAWL